MIAGLYALAGLGMLAGITALVLGWNRQPAGDALVSPEPVEGQTPVNRPVCWVDDPLYAGLGYVSTEWLRAHRGKE